MASEDLYYFRMICRDHCEIAKFTDGSKVPKDTYNIKKGHCDCFGFTSHKTECKHLKMYKWWKTKDCKPYAIEWDTMKAYSLGAFSGI